MTFTGCISLKKINIPKTLTSIGWHAFSRCRSLDSIVLPEGLKIIDDVAFESCEGLKSIILPESIDSIGEGAFYGCYKLEEVIYSATTPIEAPEDVFGSYNADIYGNATLNTPNATLAAVQTTTPWNLFKRIVAKDGSVGVGLSQGEQFTFDGVVYTVIDEENHLVKTADDANNFSGDLVIPSSIEMGGVVYTVTEIGENSFAGSSFLTSVTIQASIANIGENAFSDCERLTSLIWQGDSRLQSGVVESIANPNLLVYVNTSSNAPEGLDHNIVVMNTTDGTPSCDKLILEKGYAFHPAIDFVSLDSRMTQDYTQSTIIGQSAGWETLVLPFDAQSVYSEKRGELTPFAAITDLDIQYPFWLYEADAENEWKEAFAIKAGVPYIISMPNNPEYAECFNIDGPVTFSYSEPTLITGEIASPYAVTWAGGQDFSSMWLPLNAVQAANAMGLNSGIDNTTDENGELLPPGSAFLQGITPRPLDAYVTRTGGANIKKIMGDLSGVLTLRADYGLEMKSIDGEIILRSDTDRRIDIFAIDGTHIRSIMLRAGVAETLKDLTPGLYLIAGRKTIVR
ncbi:MAG: leucine-rich repeat domain-containing protein [Muribaculaceae bacterium]|nr:leucine-rich repeat domain-containing protein [Muribaculaceae bacterium]